MKRFWVFRNSTFYASGGFLDFKHDYDSAEEAIDDNKLDEYEWMHIFDSKNKLIMFSVGDYHGNMSNNCEIHLPTFENKENPRCMIPLEHFRKDYEKPE